MADHYCGQAETDHLGPANRTLGLFLISVLALFLELLLIRWITTEVNIFAYLQNTVLVVCFLGLGMGCMTCRQPIVLRNLLIPLLGLVLLLSIPYTSAFLAKISLMLSVLDDFVVWNQLIMDSSRKTILPVFSGLVGTFGLMFLIWGIFVPAGRILGRLMDDHPNTIVAYSVNIGGSLVGVWLFVLLSLFYQPPIIWFLVVAALLIPFVGSPGFERRINLLLLSSVVILSWPASRELAWIEVLWSPYQKIAIAEANREDVPAAKFFVTVNNSWFQWLTDLTKEKDRSISHSEKNGFSHLDIPFLLHPNPQSSLIVGAGTGNDVASALRHEVKEVTAVEIDPAVIYLGRKYHPESPYSSPKVRVVNDDARSFFANSKNRYDVISFGFLDSHTTTSMTNARLDHYVYTREGLEKARSLLARGGIMTLTFAPQRPFIADRIARVIRDVFNQEPLSFRISDNLSRGSWVMFIAGDLQEVRERIEGNKSLAQLIAKWRTQYPLQLTYETEITTDDWPYLYLRARQIPLLYYLLAVVMLILLVYAKWRLKTEGPIVRWSVSHWHFFFLGAAFLLLEVQNISKAAVVLGNTWSVNAVIISGILVMILTANLVVALFPKVAPFPVFVLLIGSCSGLYFVNIAEFAGLPYYQKAVLVGALTTLPVLFSGIVFIRSFSVAKGKDSALGANLIGSLVGGLLQSVTFITGIKALLLIVAVLYFAALLCSPRCQDLPA